MENSIEDLLKTENRTTIPSSNFTSGNISKIMKTLTQNNICTVMFLEALFTVVKTKTTQVSTNGQKEKEVVIQKHCNIVQSKMREIIWDHMDGHERHYAKWNKSDRKRQILNNFTYVYGSLKKANKIS